MLFNHIQAAPIGRGLNLKVSQQKFTPTPINHGRESVYDRNPYAKLINKSHGRKPMVWGFTEKILWTNHARDKMRHYRLTESRIKRIIRHPTRVEEGILEGAVAAMQPVSASATVGKPAESKRYSEIWVMYVLAREGGSLAPPFPAHKGNPRPSSSRDKGRGSTAPRLAISIKKIKVITAWRYPGKSPARDPVPKDILAEIRSLI